MQCYRDAPSLSGAGVLLFLDTYEVAVNVKQALALQRWSAENVVSHMSNILQV